MNNTNIHQDFFLFLAFLCSHYDRSGLMLYHVQATEQCCLVVDKY